MVGGVCGGWSKWTSESEYKWLVLLRRNSVNEGEGKRMSGGGGCGRGGRVRGGGRVC